MTSLKVDNERLQRVILQKGIDPLMVLSQGEDSSSMSPDDLRTSLSEHQGGGMCTSENNFRDDLGMGI